MTSHLLSSVLVVAFAVMTVAMAAPTQLTPVVNMTGPTGAPIPSDEAVNRHKVPGADVTQAVIDMIDHSCIFSPDNLFLRRVASAETQDGNNPDTFRHGGGIWQVDRQMFQATQAGTSALRAKYDQILQKFGIDWPHVQWSDLDRPLYSGLAAALFVSQQGEIPLNAEKQGTFLHNHYNSGSNANNYTRNVGEIPNACDGSEHADVVFLLDTTTSQENFQRMREYVRSVAQGFHFGSSNIHLAVYQFWGTSVSESIGFNSYATKQQILSALTTMPNLRASHGAGSSSHVAPSTGRALRAVLHNFASTRPNTAKIIVLVTENPSASVADMQAVGQEALRDAVSVFAVGVGSSHHHTEMTAVSTEPECLHHIMVDDFRDLKDIVLLTRHRICSEPMIAQGMVHCRLNECRNVAFPMTSSTMTVLTNVTCEDGNVYVTTRMPNPGSAFSDFKGYVRAGEEPTYVTISKELEGFIYTFFENGGHLNSDCVATIYTVNGMIDTHKECTEWQYPLYNPCVDPNRGTVDKFAYSSNNGMFIQCDLANKMYLTRCPPDEPYYNADCHTCVGPSSPALGGCGRPEENAVHSGHCGLPVNPCTTNNIAQGHFYFACPGDETMYLQCNTWGHGFVMSCPDNFVWRQISENCEYQRPDTPNPCHPGKNFYPYPSDPHYYIQCNHLVAYKMECILDFVWDDVAQTCVPPQWSTVSVTHFTRYVTTAPSVIYTSASCAEVTASNGMLYKDFHAPCTQSAIAAQQLFHPCPGNAHQYIQCDTWGDSFVKSCQSGMFFNPQSSTCVDGSVTHGEGGALVGR